jgi:hypothetical protein
VVPALLFVTDDRRQLQVELGTAPLVGELVRRRGEERVRKAQVAATDLDHALVERRLERRTGREVEHRADLLHRRL